MDKIIFFVVFFALGCLLTVNSFTNQYITCSKDGSSQEMSVKCELHEVNALLRKNRIERKFSLDEPSQIQCITEKRKKTGERNRYEYVYTLRVDDFFDIHIYPTENSCKSDATRIAEFVQDKSQMQYKKRLSDNILSRITYGIVGILFIIVSFILLSGKTITGNNLSPEEQAAIDKRKKEMEEKMGEMFNKYNKK